MWGGYEVYLEEKERCGKGWGLKRKRRVGKGEKGRKSWEDMRLKRRGKVKRGRREGMEDDEV